MTQSLLESMIQWAHMASSRLCILAVDRKPETGPADGKNMGTAVVHSSGTSKSVGPVSPTLTSALELKNRSSVNLKMVPSEAWVQVLCL